VPSAGNAEPNSPVNNRPANLPATPQQPGAANQTAPGIGTSGQSATGNSGDRATNPASEASRTPSLDNSPLGGGGSTNNRTGAGSAASGSSSGDPAVRGENGILRGTNAETAYGGGNGTLEDCMNVWDPSTHMSKELWRDTCKRLGSR
jgi:hypothetical protein